jgi:hypothetical protein
MIDPRGNFRVESPPQHAQNEKVRKKKKRWNRCIWDLGHFVLVIDSKEGNLGKRL